MDLDEFFARHGLRIDTVDCVEDTSASFITGASTSTVGDGGAGDGSGGGDGGAAPSPPRRRLVAARPIRAGTELFRNEAIAVAPTKRGTCAVCFQQVPAAAAANSFCSRCRSVQYCGVKCQRMAWPQHKRECACLRAILPRRATPNVLMLTRALRLQLDGGGVAISGGGGGGGKHARFGGLDACSAAECARVLGQLQNHRARLGSARLLEFRFVASLAQKILERDPAVKSKVCTSSGGSGDGGGAGSSGKAGGAGRRNEPGDGAEVLLEEEAGGEEAEEEEEEEEEELDELKMRSIDDGVSLLSVFQCNCHTVCDEELAELGVGLYAAGAVVNHSCDPNAIVVYRGTTQVFRAVRDIPAGDEVTIAYTDLAQPGLLRRQRLREGYLFECGCARCRSPTSRQRAASEQLALAAPRPAAAGAGAGGGAGDADKVAGTVGVPAAAAELDAAEKAVRAAGDAAGKGPKVGAAAADVNAAERALVARAIARLDAAGCGPAHYQRVRALGMLQANLLVSQDFEAALGVAQRLAAALEAVLDAATSAVLGLQFFKLGKLAWFLGRAVPAAAALEKAAAVLCVTHGGDAPLVRELLRQLDEARAEIRHLGLT